MKYANREWKVQTLTLNSATTVRAAVVLDSQIDILAGHSSS